MNHRPVVKISARSITSNGIEVGRCVAVPPGGWREPVSGSRDQRWRAILFARHNVPVIAAERQQDLVVEVAKHLAGEYPQPELAPCRECGEPVDGVSPATAARFTSGAVHDRCRVRR